MQSFKQHCRYVKGVPFVNRTVYKRVSFKKKKRKVYKRVRGWTLGRGLPLQNFIEYHPDNDLSLTFITLLG